MAGSSTFERFARFTAQAQDEIIAAIEAIDGARFERKDWQRPEGGGGHMAVLRGNVIEKGAVLRSRVHGDTNPLTGSPFIACGLSLILHPRNPHAPTVHLNVRRFEEPARGWWGGGIDLTPMGIRHEVDVKRFHEALATNLGTAYRAGRDAATTYFHVPHRGRERGAGGVFYDHLETDGPQQGHALMERIVASFHDAYLPILQRRMDEAYTEAERAAQARERGVYVEFNLLYDRGTRFGFQSGGNPEAILSSLPPTAAW